MEHTITVRGLGRASAVPDSVEISLTLNSRNKQFELAMDKAGADIDKLTAAVTALGFDKKQLKTTGFNTYSDYETQFMNNGPSRQIFKGYVVSHSLTLRFDMDSELLSRVLSSVSSCLAEPQLSVRFTVKDSAAVCDEVLRSAAENARRKALVLCEASGVKLGKLVSIDYSFGELHCYSETSYSMGNDCVPMAQKCRGVEIAPDDINVSENVTFVWSVSD